MISRTLPSAVRHFVSAAALAASVLTAPAGEVTLLNASYDVTREFYKDYNAAFATHWEQTTGDKVTINQSHGGSSKQVRAVIDGLEADVVTMNQALDVDQLVKPGLIPADWATRMPHNSAPYTSTILFVVRQGNPKKIKDWSDLVRADVKVVIPNPKTSGNGRYSYLAAWGYALRQPGGDATKAEAFVRQLFANVPVLDTGGRGATTTFAKNGIGDVLLTFENEVALTIREFASENLEAVVPTASITAENPVVWVDKVVSKKGSATVARAYLEYLYSPEAQELAARHYFRPRDPAVLARHANQFKSLQLFTVEDVAGSWAEAQKTHFADGGVFDRIYVK
ncbi:MAG: sulfate ABC transporter substrate-binding protein [Opitutaceae bacterium]|nr:sulfate ABC transporter substrate-binding protein [Opitutaceae bacterium]